MNNQTFFKQVFILAIILLITNCAFSQNTVATKTDSLDNKRAQNVYAEIGGPGIIFSLNYDTRFANKQDGIGGRVGVGGFSVDGASILTVPLQLNYLIGRDNKFFEIGIGATLVSGKIGGIFGSTTIGTMVFGYRLQPKNSGFNFRAFISPIFNDSGFSPYFGGISFGYSF